MRFLAPTNWDENLIAPLSKMGPDIQIYGVLPTTVVGSGGSGPHVPEMTRDRAEDYVKLAHSAGMTFDYLLNAPSMGNMEWEEKTHRELLEHLEWLSDIGVDNITVAIPYLVELIKKQFPHFSVRASTISKVNSVARAQLLESLGVDSITLDAHINRDFKVLRAIRKAVKCELSVLMNNLCLYQCPYEYYHYSALGHSSQSYNQLNGFPPDYCVLRCTIDRLTDSSQMIKARWIRPEDIHLYEEIGITTFKISSRSMPTESILRASAAYLSGQYQGNLYDILHALNPTVRWVSPGSGKIQSATIGSPPKIYIDNQALDGFIEFFKKQDCLSGCANCDYCREIADKAIRFDRREVDEYLAELEAFMDNLTSSRIYHPVST
jgi:collagenase-like PrtC family protease